MLSLHDHIHTRITQLSCLSQLSNQFFSHPSDSFTSKTQLLSLIQQVKTTEISRREREDNLLGFAYYQKEDGFKELKLIMYELMPLGQIQQIKCLNPLQTFKEFLKSLGLEERYEGVIQGINANQLNYNACYIIMFKLLVDLSRKQLTNIIKDVYQKLNTINSKEYDTKLIINKSNSLLLKNMNLQTNESSELNISQTPRILVDIKTLKSKNQHQQALLGRLQSAKTQTNLPTQSFFNNLKYNNNSQQLRQFRVNACLTSIQVKKLGEESSPLKKYNKQNINLKNCKIYFRLLCEIINDLEFSSFSIIFNTVFNTCKTNSLKETQLFKSALSRNSLILKKHELFSKNFDKIKYAIQTEKFKKYSSKCNQSCLNFTEMTKVNQFQTKPKHPNYCYTQIQNLITQRKTNTKLTLLKPHLQNSLDNSKLKLPQKSYFVNKNNPSNNQNSDYTPFKLNYLDFPLQEKQTSFNQFSQLKIVSNSNIVSAQEKQLKSRLKIQYQAYLHQKKGGVQVASNDQSLKYSSLSKERPISSIQSYPFSLQQKFITLPLQQKEPSLKEEKQFLARTSIIKKSLYKPYTKYSKASKQNEFSPKNLNSGFDTIFLNETPTTNKSPSSKTCKFNRISTALKRNYLI